MAGVPPQAAPERLTELLRGAGVVASGEVIDVAVETSRDTLISRIARLRLPYGGSSEAGPSHLFFKTQRDGIDTAPSESGRREVAFYNLVAVATPAGLLPRCYEAAAEPQWHLILEDLTASHQTLGD